MTTNRLYSSCLKPRSLTMCTINSDSWSRYDQMIYKCMRAMVVSSESREIISINTSHWSSLSLGRGRLWSVIYNQIVKRLDECQ